MDDLEKYPTQATHLATTSTGTLPYADCIESSMRSTPEIKGGVVVPPIEEIQETLATQAMVDDLAEQAISAAISALTL
jgi:hypothetical protein